MTRIKETLTMPLHFDEQTLAIPDEPGHAYQLSEATMLATEAEPSEIEGESLVYNKIFWYVTFENWKGGSEYVDHGFWERVMPGGDRIFAAFNGQSGEVKITGGTGKFEGIRGSGRYKGEVIHSGIWQASYEWEYQIG